jgi:photosystem II stability/assembly factor-like uncharacterized protein
VIAVVATVAGTFAVDLDDGEVTATELEVERERVELNLPRVLDASAAGATVVALVAAKPPLLVSYDAGTTWREAGRGLPPGRAVAVSADDPDVVLYAARNRLYVSRNGGVFWSALDVELPEIAAVSL